MRKNHRLESFRLKKFVVVLKALKKTNVEPTYNEGPTDWQNLFAVSRFRYIEVLFYIFYYYWVEENRLLYREHRYVEICYIEVPPIKNRSLRFLHKSFKSEWVWQIVASYLCLYMLAFFSTCMWHNPTQRNFRDIFCVYECMCMCKSNRNCRLLALQILAPEDLSWKLTSQNVSYGSLEGQRVLLGDLPNEIKANSQVQRRENNTKIQWSL